MGWLCRGVHRYRTWPLSLGRFSSVPALTPLSSLYGPLTPGRNDELPHNEFPDQVLFAAMSYGGTAPTAAGLIGPRPAGIPARDMERYGSWPSYGMRSGL